MAMASRAAGSSFDVLTAWRQGRKTNPALSGQDGRAHAPVHGQMHGHLPGQAHHPLHEPLHEPLNDPQHGRAPGHAFPYELEARPSAVAPAPEAGAQPRLHISGYDPRAAGGRQAIRIDLLGLPANVGGLVLQLRSDLIPDGRASYPVSRTLHGQLRPVVAEFSSRDKEHGQYRIEVELASHADGRVLRQWVSTLLILVPRSDAALADIHQAFLATHKNVRIVADDASIAKFNAQTGGGRLDIDVKASNASIAQVQLDHGGKAKLGYSTLAWDEDLTEISVSPRTDGLADPALPVLAAPHPHPLATACIVNAAPDAVAERHLRLFALDECLLGRCDSVHPEADLQLAHYGEHGPDYEGLTRRLSARHAVIRRGPDGFEIEDVSRYGLLLDGVWPGKHVPVVLRLGMRIELTASIKGVAVLSVTALLPHAVVLHRLDHGAAAEVFYLVAPDRHPGVPLPPYPATPRASMLPILFHRNGGFWHLDPANGRETALTPTTALASLSQCGPLQRFAAAPYPELRSDRRMAPAASGVSAVFTL